MELQQQLQQNASYRFRIYALQNANKMNIHDDQIDVLPIFFPNNNKRTIHCASYLFFPLSLLLPLKCDARIVLV